ncbi:fatty acid desaturase [Nocardia tenerifensis]|uniref:Fatty acid desaturase n=1 Tax=Nocardia tenerifensis TaxID=228006 RepID=A0A318JX05_9NOCA|nr:acyl-ACP desaturase [Nocardia tenerifensis]PXX58105.1 fatty acid desaturase [Nocardia tenerifensis]
MTDLSTVSPARSTTSPHTEEPIRGLPFMDIRACVEPAVQLGADRGWNLADVRWGAIEPGALTRSDEFVIRFTTFIEDHIPGYVTSLLANFPVVGEDIDLDEFCGNREYFRFLMAWAYDEERHASALTHYQIAAGLADEEELLRELAAEGRKQFQELPGTPLEAFVYTMVQEKATHLFYQRFHAVAQEPVLRDLLQRLGRDEARHFALYRDLVAAYLRRHGTRTLPHLKNVLENFKMPLTASLTDYWRWSLCAPKSVRFDVTDAYEPVGRLVRELVDSPGSPDVDDLLSFITEMRQIA